MIRAGYFLASVVAVLGCGGRSISSQAETGTSDVGGTGEVEDEIEFVAVGIRTSCVGFDAGAIRCWGEGGHGQLGYGEGVDIGDDEMPREAAKIALPDASSELAIGNLHACARTETGHVYCWGDNSLGYLGYGTKGSIVSTENLDPVSLPGPASRIVAGRWHTCALVDSEVFCWGDWAYVGYPGDETIGDDEVPSDVGPVPVGGAVADIAAGGSHTCALMHNGGVRCWGISIRGALGYPGQSNVGDDETPAELGDVDLGDPATAIACGDENTCARIDEETVVCWGSGDFGVVGAGPGEHIGWDSPPSQAPRLRFEPIRALSGGGMFFCVLTTSGDVKCWGGNINGVLGTASTGQECDIDALDICDGGASCCFGDHEDPTDAPAIELGGRAVSLSTGLWHSCALLESGDTRCWGRGDGGVLGTGSLPSACYNGDCRDDPACCIGDDESPGSLPPVAVF